MLDDGTVGRVSALVAGNSLQLDASTSLSEYLRKNEIDDDVARILLAAATASAQVARELRVLSLANFNSDRKGNINVQGKEQKGMDVRANEIFIQQLKPVVATIVSEEEENIVAGDGESYSVAFDPLDGSSNLDVIAPTGSIFGIYCHNDSDSSPFEKSARQSLVVAGYALYSSATELVISGIGDETAVFTLDDSNAFRCSRTNLTCPDRGPYYSLNEAREPD
jgi:fructose-1,6-bisphosphatase I